MVASSRVRQLPESIKINLRLRGVPTSGALARFIQERLATSLGRFSSRLRAVTVWIEDVNGPRGGTDKRCRLDLELLPRGRFAVNATAESEFTAFVQAADKARTVLHRRIKQVQTNRRRLHRIDNFID